MKGFCLIFTGLPPLLLTVGRNGSAGGKSSRLAFSVLIAVAVVLIAVANRRKQAAAASRKPGPTPSRRPAARPEKRPPVSAPGVRNDKEKKREEGLKGLLEAGLISREEYRERMSAIGGSRKETDEERF